MIQLAALHQAREVAVVWPLRSVPIAGATAAANHLAKGRGASLDFHATPLNAGFCQKAS
jgi:hypothetical protein